MLRKLLISSYLLMLLVIVMSGTAWAESAQVGGYDMMAQADQGYKNIAKVKPAPAPSTDVTKVKPYGWTSRFEGISRVQSN